MATLLICLLMADTVAWAAPASFSDVISNAYRVPSKEVQVSNLVEKIQIPSSLGTIQDQFVSRSTFPVSLIHIEDAHGEPEAQKNTQAILEHLQKKYSIQTFFLEGAWSKLDPKLIRNISPENRKELTQKGILGGAELFLNQEPGTKNQVTGYGVEDLGLYEKNLEQFRVVLSAKSETDSFLNEMKAGLLTKASQVLKKELGEYFRQWSFHEEVSSDYGAHIRVLTELSKRNLQIDLNAAREQYDWPQLVRFQKLKSYELRDSGSVNRDSSRAEEENLQEWLSEKKLKAEWIFNHETQTTNHESRGTREMFETFYAAAAPQGFSFKDYPELSKIWGKKILEQELDAPTLINEMEALENKLIEKLAKTSDEKKLIRKYREYLLLKKLLHLELSKKEWVTLRGTRYALHAARTEYRVQSEVGLKNAVSVAYAFYETAELRDEAMLNHTLDWIKKENIEKAAIITGGFHSDGLSKLFKQKNISYLRIQPRITQIKGRDNYLKLMTSTVRAPSFAEPGIASLPSWEKRYEHFSPKAFDIAPASDGSDSSRSEMRVETTQETEQFYSTAQVDAQIKTQGFSAMRKYWKLYKRLGAPLISTQEIQKLRTGHMGFWTNRGLASGAFWITGIGAAFFTALALNVSSILIFGASALAMLFMGSDLDPSFWEMVAPNASFFGKMSQVVTVGIEAFLGNYFIVLLQRRWIYPLKKIAALDLGVILRSKNFRENLPKLLDVSSEWDNPKYRVQYKFRNNQYEKRRVDFPQPLELVRDILGEVKQKQSGSHAGKKYHAGGKYTSDLADEKPLIRAKYFIHEHQATLQALQQKILAPDEVKILLSALMQKMKPASLGAQAVERYLNSLEGTIEAGAGTIQAEIWQRDPMKDLTESTEFYSSASIDIRRHLGFRSSGALGAFGHLHNPAITALDLRRGKKRMIRVRLAAVWAADQDGKKHSVLFVDAVEGSDQINPELIQQTIEDYGRTAGFKTVFYNGHIHNQVPKRFVAHLKKTGLTPVQAELEFMNAGAREYLDAWGWPLEPFEYAYPKGAVGGFAKPLTEEKQPQFSAESKKLQFKQWLRFKLVNMIGTALLMPIVLNDLARGEWSFKIYAFLAAGIAANWFYTHRSTLKIRFNSKADANRSEMRWLENLENQILKHPDAVKMNYSVKLQQKLTELKKYFPEPPPSLQPFFENLLWNVSIQPGDLQNALKFLNSADSPSRDGALKLIASVFNDNEMVIRVQVDGLSAQKQSRENLKKETLRYLDAARRFTQMLQTGEGDSEIVRKINNLADVLKIKKGQALEIVLMSSKILRGFNRHFRAWHVLYSILPIFVLAFAALAMGWIPAAAGLLIVAVVVALGGFIFKWAPGILRNNEVQKYLMPLFQGQTLIAAEGMLSRHGIDAEEYEKEQVYVSPESKAQLIKRDKRTLNGAIRFLVSSDLVASCIALQNYESWAIPALLKDPAIQLVDIYLGGQRDKHLRAQMWLVAGEENGMPVLTVNSFEFNDEGAKYRDVLLPQAIKVLQDVGKRSGFKKIYVGITDIGREWLDQNFTQGKTAIPIVKIHDASLGHAYHFDAYERKGNQWVYAKERGWIKRTYSMVMGIFEWMRRHSDKAAAFFETAKNPHNFWEIPIDGRSDQPALAGLIRPKPKVRSEMRRQNGLETGDPPSLKLWSGEPETNAALGRQPNVVEGHVAQSGFIAKFFTGIQNFYSRQFAMSIKVDRNPFGDMLRGDSRIFKLNIKSVYFGVIRDFHKFLSSLKIIHVNGDNYNPFIFFNKDGADLFYQVVLIVPILIVVEIFSALIAALTRAFPSGMFNRILNFFRGRSATQHLGQSVMAQDNGIKHTSAQASEILYFGLISAWGELIRLLINNQYIFNLKAISAMAVLGTFERRYGISRSEVRLSRVGSQEAGVDAAAVGRSEMRMDFFEFLKNELGEGSLSLIDVGANPGDFSIKLEAMARKQGVQLSISAIDHEFPPSLGNQNPNINWIQENIQDYFRASKKYDVVIINAPDLVGGEWDDVFKLVSENGIIIVRDWAKDWGSSLAEIGQRHLFERNGFNVFKSEDFDFLNLPVLRSYQKSSL